MGLCQSDYGLPTQESRAERQINANIERKIELDYRAE
jgi:hypothetical protein